MFIISDHGEMIGELGIIYKFNPLEGSVWVLMLAMSPGFSRGSLEPRPTSLLELLLTFTDIASDHWVGRFVIPIEERSILDLPSEDDKKPYLYRVLWRRDSLSSYDMSR